MFTAVALTLFVSSSVDPSAVVAATVLARQAVPAPDAPATEAGEPGVAEEAAAGDAPQTPPADAATASDPAPAAAQTPAASPTPAAASAEKDEEAEEDELESFEPKPYTGRIRYVWPFAKEHELLPGDVRIPLGVWLMAVGGGAAVAAGVPFYTIARATETRLISGSNSIRTDAERADTVRFGRTMEAWGVGLWATGGVLVVSSWAAFYLLGFQDKPKGLNYSMSVGPQGGMLQLELALP